MPGIVLVPMHVSLLQVADVQYVVPPIVDFSNLPWTDGQHDYNATTPYLSLNILRPPFYSGSFSLQTGTHLHWYLPAVYRRAFIANVGNEHVYCPAPNLWLVRRSLDDHSRTEWVVESDVVLPPSHFEHSSGSSMPYHQQGTPPFRMIGRTLPLQEWFNEGTAQERYENLTAMGYGDPAFSFYYPACSRCFGFHDADGLGFTTPVTYEVIGWRRESDHNLLSWIPSHTRLANRLTLPELFSESGASLGWHLYDLNDAGKKPIPGAADLVVCYSRVTVNPTSATLTRRGESQVAVGCNATNALTAHLVEEIMNEGNTRLTQSQLEEQLDHLGALTTTEKAKTDKYFKMLESRHQDSFVAIPGGIRWALRNEPYAETADTIKSANRAAHEIPVTLVSLLETVNVLQTEYEHAHHHVTDLQEQLFADWHHYQRAMYPEDPRSALHADADEIKSFIQRHTLVQLDAARQAAGEIVYKFDVDQTLVRASVSQHNTGHKAEALSAAINRLLHTLSIVNSTCISGHFHDNIVFQTDPSIGGYLQFGTVGSYVRLDHLSGLNGSALHPDRPLTDFSLIFWMKLEPNEGGVVLSFDPTQWFEIEVPPTGSSQGRLIFATVNVRGESDRMESDVAIGCNFNVM